jgi:hypothetical protein
MKKGEGTYRINLTCIDVVLMISITSKNEQHLDFM